jgi:hypothetical protein
MVMSSAGDDLFLPDLTFYSTLSDFFTPAILIYHTEEFVSQEVRTEI